MNVFDRIRGLLPEWSPVRWIALILATAVLVFTGISLFFVPGREVIYSTSRFVMPIKENNTIMALYTMELGNTGSEDQENVKLRFSRAAMKKAILPISVKNYGVSDRDVVVSNDQSTTTIFLGALESEKRVRIMFTLSYPQGTAPDEWETVLLAVEPAKGSVKKGDPGMTMVGRAWFNLFGDVLPF